MSDKFVGKFIDLSDARQVSYNMFNYNNRKIFIKRNSGNCEALISEAIAKMLDINSLHYEIAYFRGELVLFSEKFYRDDEQFIFGENLLREYRNSFLEESNSNVPLNKLNNLTDIWGALEFKFGSEYSIDAKIVLNDIIKMFCLDLLLNKNDRHDLNWGIIQSDNHIRLAPIYDTESVENDRCILISTDSKTNISTSEILQEFLNTSDSYWKDIFYTMFDMLTVSRYEEILKNVEISKEIKFKDKEMLIEAYKNHRSELETIIENCRCKKM